MTPTGTKKLSSPARPVREFATLPEALNFVVSCLETGRCLQLLAEVYDVGQRVAYSPQMVDRFKTAFQLLWDIHCEQDLRTLCRDQTFPHHGDQYEVGGYLTTHASIALYFVRLKHGWALAGLDYL